MRVRVHSIQRHTKLRKLVQIRKRVRRRRSIRKNDKKSNRRNNKTNLLTSVRTIAIVKEVPEPPSGLAGLGPGLSGNARSLYITDTELLFQSRGFDHRLASCNGSIIRTKNIFN
jgi:hypothetical protein